MPAASLRVNRLALPTYTSVIQAIRDRWTCLVPYALLAGGVTALFYGGWRGEAGWLIPLGVALVVASGVRGAHWGLALAALPVVTFRYLLFAVPPMAGTGLSLKSSFAILALAAVWEAAPLLASVGAGAWMSRRRAPQWLLFLVVAGLYTGTSVWMPRPYGFAFAAPVVHEIPGMIWAFGTDLAGGLLLGFAFLPSIWSIRRTKGMVMLAWTGGLVGALLAAHAGFRIWQGQCSGVSRKVVEHDTLAIPGGLAPFVSNYKTMSDRAIYPMILFSAMRPDLIMGPENLIQANAMVDPDNEQAALQRHITSIGTAIAVPFSQSLFGVRDHHTARIYFSDLIEGKPRVQWKDLGKRTPGVDVAIPKLQRLFTKDYLPSIQAPKSLPLMDLWKRETDPDAAYHQDEVQGLRRVSRAVITMSGEIRDPKLVRVVTKDKTITAAMNPNIGGWLGAHEAVGAGVQARARLLELGLIGYRVGQTAGTELVVPWLEDALPSVMAPNKSFLRFRAPLPLQRVETVYTAVMWRIALFAMPAVGLLVLLAWCLRGIPAVGQFLQEEA